MSHVSTVPGGPAAELDVSLDRDNAVPTAPALSFELAEWPASDRKATPPPQFDTVDILLCTYNGARFLPRQLASFEIQTFPHWRLIVSDDGSQDETLALLSAFAQKYGADKVQIRHGPRKGPNANFLSLICDPTLDSAFFALSDQDDVWAADKLSRARAFFLNAPADRPAAYCSRTRVINEHGAGTGMTQLFAKPPRFRNALVQNIAIGNTTLFNQQTRRLLMQAGPDVNVAVHDWWIYLVVTAVGGTMVFDPYPTVNYRIHGGNLVGVNNNRIRRAWAILRRYKGWNDANMQALGRIEGLMLPENKKTFELFRRARERSLVPRLYGLLRSGVYREKLSDNVGLALAAVLGQI